MTRPAVNPAPGPAPVPSARRSRPRSPLRVAGWFSVSRRNAANHPAIRGAKSKRQKAAVGAEAGRQAVADEDDGGKGMRDRVECGFGAPAAKAGEANAGVQLCEILARQSGSCGCRFSGLRDGPPGLVQPNSGGGRSRTRFTEHPAGLILDPCAAAGSAAIDAQIKAVFRSHRNLTRGLRFGSVRSALMYIRRHVKPCARLASRVRDHLIG